MARRFFFFWPPYGPRPQPAGQPTLQSTQPTVARQWAAALSKKGDALVQLKRPDDALSAYQDVIDRFSGIDERKVRDVVTRTKFQKAILLEKTDRVDEAVALYGDIIESAEPPRLWELFHPTHIATVQRARLLGRQSGTKKAKSSKSGATQRSGAKKKTSRKAKKPP